MIAWTLRDRVAELTLNAPPCNEIGRPMLVALEGFLDAFDPESADALIIRSEQAAGFSAGADLRALYEQIADRPVAEWRDDLVDFIDRIHAVMDRLDMLPVTTIAVVHGVCFGGGFELALTADLRIVEKTARFAFPELRLGIVPGFGGIPRLDRDVGNAVVRDLLLTGRSINAKKAVEIGLASTMVPKGRGVDAARRLASQSTKYDPTARRACKAFMKPLPAAHLAREKALFLELFQRPVVVDALKNFYESSDVRPYLA